MATQQVTGPREVFAERFALLYAEAGNPPLKRVSESVLRAREADERGRRVEVPAQRISDWRRGRNVPARFAGLSLVLAVLIGEARKRRPDPVIHELYSVDAWRELWETALASPSGPEVDGLDEAGLPTAPDQLACPYRGLAAFQQTDTEWFFGRRRSTDDLVGCLRQSYADGGFAVLVGASGAGKSSLLRAGLGPQIAPGRLAAEQESPWPVVLITPGVEPLKQLASQFEELEDTLDRAVAQVRAGSDPSSAGWFADDLRAAARAAAERRSAEGLVLVVDQLEEVFTLSADEDARLLFVRALRALCTGADGAPAPALVVLGVRADFYDRCLAYPEIVEALRGRQMALGAMSAAELRDAVVRPAKAVGLQLEPGLIDLVLADIGVAVHRVHGRVTTAGYESGALPLLSHALLATWQRRQAGRLTIAGYRSAGGIHGAVAATAERAWSELDADGKAAARRLLLHLVQVGDTTRDVRRRSTRAELVDHHGHDAVAAERALEVLTNARLVTMDAGSVEITHEALLEAWPRLRSWIDDNRAENLARQRLESDAAAWEEQSRDASLLYRGARLEATERMAKGGDGVEITQIAKAFVRDSVRQHRRSRWFWRSGVALVCVLGLLAVVAASIAVNQRDDAQFRQLVTEADRQLGIEPSLGAQLTLAAHRLRPDDESLRSKLLSAQHLPLAMPLRGHEGPIYLTDFSPDGGLLATASFDETVRLWDVSDRDHPRAVGEPLSGHGGWVSSAVFSPDGRTLATAGADETVRLWDVSDPARAHQIGKPLEGGNGIVYLLEFSPDGRTLVTANEDMTARLWNVADPARPEKLGKPLAGHTGQVRSVAFEPTEGKLLATTGDDRTIRLWNVANPARPKPVGKPLTGHDLGIHTVAFSPDGAMLATGADDNTVRLWDVANPARAKAHGVPLTGHSAKVWSVKFSPDGSTLASASEDSTVRLWNVAGGGVPLGPPLGSRSNGNFALDFSPDGTLLSTGSGDSVVRLWSIPRNTLVGHMAGVMQPAFSPDGKVLASGGRAGQIRLWEVTDAGAPRPLGEPMDAHESYVKYLVFRPDGELMASASGDKTVRLWDVSDPAKVRPVGDPLRLNTQYASPLAMSPDGGLLVTGASDESIQLWDISTPADPEPIGAPVTAHAPYVHHATFSPDGRTLVTVGSDETIRLWDVADGSSVRPLGDPLTGHDGEVFASAFTPDGAVLATGGGDGHVLLWDVSDRSHPRRIGSPLTGHSEAVDNLAFSPDGRALATGSTDRTVRLWDLADPNAARPIGTGMTAYVESEYLVAFNPARDLLATGSGDGVVRLWDLNLDRSIDRICAATSGALTEALWRQHVPEMDYEPPCG